VVCAAAETESSEPKTGKRRKAAMADRRMAAIVSFRSSIFNSMAGRLTALEVLLRYLLRK